MALPINTSIISSIPLYNTLQKKTTYIKWQAKKTLHLFVFLSPDCPLCRNYAPIINKLEHDYKEEIEIYGIIPGASYPDSEVNEFIHTFSVKYPVLKDSKQQLKKQFNATTTPEVYLLDDAGIVIYRGAIDNWAIDLGKKRVQATEYYLAEAVKNKLNNIPVAIRYVQPVGCIINDY